MLAKSTTPARLLADGNHFFDRGQLKEALLCFQQAERELGPHPELSIRLGAVQLSLRQLEQAELRFRAAARDPKFAPIALECLGLMLKESGRFQEAIQVFEEVLLLRPHNPHLWGQMGHVLSQLGRYEEARKALHRSVSMMPTAEAWMALAFAHRCVSAWSEAEHALEQAKARFHELDEALNPLTAILLGLPFEESLAIAKRHAASLPKAKPSVPTRSLGKKIHVGYLSPDLTEHPVGLLLHGLLPHHNRNQFRVSAFALRRALPSDTVRPLIESSVDAFIDMTELSDEESAARIRSEGVDVLVDLAGYSLGGRPGILSRRPAPIQCSWLGYPGSLGADFIDFQISHERYIPETHRDQLPEDLEFLPDTAFASQGFSMPAKPPTRAELGLPEDPIVFCCFHNPYRIGRKSFDLWLEILGRVPESILWLMEGGTTQQQRLLDYAKSRGLCTTRIQFHPRTRLSDHWPHRAADLWLDCVEVSGGTSGFLCAWAEVPMLTCWGPSQAERTGAMVMEGLGLSNWVVPNEQAYVEQAVEWVTTPGKLGELRDTLKKAKQSAPLFRPAEFVGQLEGAFERRMWLAHQAQ